MREIHLRRPRCSNNPYFRLVTASPDVIVSEKISTVDSRQGVHVVHNTGPDFGQQHRVIRVNSSTKGGQMNSS